VNRSPLEAMGILKESAKAEQINKINKKVIDVFLISHLLISELLTL